LFTDWLDGINRKLKYKILVGASAICWVIWLTRNNIIFDKAAAPSYLQVIFRGPTGPGPGPYFRRRRIAKKIKTRCRIIETTAMEVFARYGWRFSNRIAL
jgi:hypothetical protein